MEDEINILEYGRVILKRSKVFLGVMVVITTSVLIYSFYLPNMYRSSATITPLGGSQQANALAASMSQSGLGFLSGGFAGGSSGQLQAILKSRTLAERVLERHGLLKHFYPELWDEQNQKWKQKVTDTGRAVRNLRRNFNFSDDVKLQTLSLSVEFSEPVVAKSIMEAYLAELQNYLEENTLTIAKRNRIFIENQLERNKAEILELGKDLASFYATNRISNVVSKMDVNVSQIGLSTKKTVTEPEKTAPALDIGLPGVPSAFAETEKKIDDLQKKAYALETQIQKEGIVKDVPPDVYLQYLTVRRELLGYVNNFLAQQYEMAKIEEAKEDLKFRVIDPPLVPKGKSGPLRLRMFFISLVASSFVAFFVVFFLEHLEKLKSGSVARMPTR